MNKQSVIMLVVALAVGFGLGWWLKPVPEESTSNAIAKVSEESEEESTEESTPLTEAEQVALDFFIAAYIYADHEKIQPLHTDYIHPKRFDRTIKPGTVYVGTKKSGELDEYQEVYIFYPLSGDVYSIDLSSRSGEWKVYRSATESVGPGGDYTFEEFTETEKYQYLRVYEWKEAMAE